MKKLIVFAMFLFACTGPMGPPGSMGLMGDAGEDGIDGADGKDADAVDIIAAFSQRLSAYEPSIFNVLCNVPAGDGTDDYRWVRGTGTKISDTEVLTAFHVVEGAVRCDLYFLNDIFAAISNPTITQTVINDTLQDVAIISNIKFSTKGQALNSVPFDDNYTATAGELIGLISYPDTFANEVVYTFGRVAVASASVAPDQRDSIVVDLVSWHGSSGGPVFNADGIMIGVLVSGYDTQNYDLRFVNALRNL